MLYLVKIFFIKQIYFIKNKYLLNFVDCVVLWSIILTTNTRGSLDFTLC